MKNIKKRLPALLLALVIVVMPLLMALPVSAAGNVLEGVSESGESYLAFPLHSGDIFYAPDLALNGVSVFDSDQCVIFCRSPQRVIVAVSVSRDKVKSFALTEDNCLVVQFDGTVLNQFTQNSGSGGSWIPWSSSMDSSANLSCADSNFWIINAPDGVSLPSGGPPDVYLYSPSISSGPGIFTVFSGVSSWLAGAVNSMVSMFWTAEGGLSVLGFLAVISLAVAFIILLIYLLAGWLRFK